MKSQKEVIPANSPDTDTAIPKTEEVDKPLKVASKPLNKKNLVILLAAVLAAGGAASYLLLRNHNLDSSTANSSNIAAVSGIAAHASDKDAFFVQENTTGSVPGDSDISFISIDPSTGTKENFYTIKNNSNSNTNLLGYIRLGTVGRKFLQTSKAGDKTTTVSIAYQDDDKPIKTLQSVTYTDGQTDWTQLFPGFSNSSVDPSGKNIDILELRNDSRAIKRVDIDGKVQELASETGISSTAPWGVPGFANIIPGGRSEDGKTLYFNSYTCLNCDGPSHADIVALDLATKKFTMVFSNPVSNTNGSWTAINNKNFWVNITDRSGLGSFSYEEEISKKDYVYIYDTNLKTSKKIFETTPNEQSASILGKSKEGDKVYVAITNQSESSELIDDASPAEGHHWLSNTKEVREYSAADGTYTVLKLPLDFSTTQPTAINSIKDQLLIFTNPSARSSYESSDKNDMNVLLMKKGDAQAKSLGTYDSTKSYVTFFSFSN